jgi:hypothetical protein
MEFCEERDSPNKGGRHKSRAAFLLGRFTGSGALIKKRKSIPMETQPGRLPAEAATPMAHASSKRSAVPGKSTSVLPRHALKSMGAGSSGTPMSPR